MFLSLQIISLSAYVGSHNNSLLLLFLVHKRGGPRLILIEGGLTRIQLEPQ